MGNDVRAARDRPTGACKDSYAQLTHDVVIRGAKQRRISAVATVPQRPRCQRLISAFDPI